MTPGGLARLVLLAALGAAGCGETGAPAQEPAIPPADAAVDVLELTIAGLEAALNRGLTCESITAAHLARIRHVEESTRINAITVINEGALDRARALDRKRAAGEPPGPLFCVPVLVKDNFDTHDLLTTGGSIALKDHVPPDDAFMVRRLREADAIVVAKTNMAEWAFSPRRTESSSFGITANAYARDRVPAGSSGGTASGIAASYAVIGLGTDTGNSIRGPSSHLALFGIRATVGLTSRDGIIPLAFDLDVAGPMTRTVRDGALAFNVLAGFDPADPLTRLGRGRREADYTRFLREDGLAGMRIGVLRALSDVEDADPGVLALFELALADLAAAGATVVDPVVIPNFQQHLDGDYFCPRFRYDVYRYLTAEGRPQPFTDVAVLLETGQHADYVRDNLEFFAGYPLDVAPDDWEPPCPTFPHHPGRQTYLEDVLLAMDEADVALLAYPTWNNVPAHLDRPRAEYKGDNSQRVAPATGLPAATVPMGFVDGNLPAGLQLLGRPWSEGTLFQAAYAYEQATAHRKPPDLAPAGPDQP